MSNDDLEKGITKTQNSRIRYANEPSYQKEATLDEEWERHKNKHQENKYSINPNNPIFHKYTEK